jgi:hypothetical protein
MLQNKFFNGVLLLGFAGDSGTKRCKGEKKMTFFKREYHYLAPEPFNPKYGITLRNKSFFVKNP